jgi:hypothetical protein
VRKSRGLVKCVLRIARDLLEQASCSRRIGLQRFTGELKSHCERDQVLLHAVVQFAFDTATGGVSGQGEPLPGLSEFLDFETELFERLP